MGIQLATSTRNAMLDAIETDAGTSAVLFIYSGSQPASCAASEAGTMLVQYSLASDWAANASGGSKAFNNIPLSVPASAGGTAGHFRITKSDGTTCTMQGSITATGGGGDMIIDNTSIASGQTVNVTGFTINAPNA